jgi:alpha-ketoglutarate-dependent 2,4-dichlorophenoxyacetate dioxygenase
MPHATGPPSNPLTITPLAPTFAASITGVDFTHPIPPSTFTQILTALSHHGILVFRNASLTDTTHISFARLFGSLDDIKPYLGLGRKNRFQYDELFDVSNQEDDGSITQLDSRRDHQGRGNSLFHVDSSFNPRRAGFSLLRAHELPPPGMGGNTEFADTRTAFDELDPELKALLLEKDYVGCHSLWHSRMKAVPDSPYFKGIDPEDYPFGRHKIVQKHEASGRMNLYIANHLHHLEDEAGNRVPAEEGTALIEKLLAHATQPKYVCSVDWQQPGDLVVWDNTAVMHRAAEGTFAGKYKRDMRRCTVHDGSSQAWGLNERTTKRMGLP